MFQKLPDITDDKPIDRDYLIRLVSDVLKKSHHRISAKRFQEREGDSTKLAYIRAISSLAQTLNTILRDDDIDQMKKDIEELKQEANTRKVYP